MSSAAASALAASVLPTPGSPSSSSGWPQPHGAGTARWPGRRRRGSPAVEPGAQRVDVGRRRAGRAAHRAVPRPGSSAKRLPAAGAAEVPGAPVVLEVQARRRRRRRSCRTPGRSRSAAARGRRGRSGSSRRRRRPRRPGGRADRRSRPGSTARPPPGVRAPMSRPAGVCTRSRSSSGSVQRRPARPRRACGWRPAPTYGTPASQRGREHLLLVAAVRGDHDRARASGGDRRRSASVEAHRVARARRPTRGQRPGDRGVAEDGTSGGRQHRLQEDLERAARQARVVDDDDARALRRLAGAAVGRA